MHMQPSRNRFIKLYSDLPINAQVFEDLESQDSERREEEENEADQQARLEALTRAQVRFSLTACSPANQLKVNTKG